MLSAKDRLNRAAELPKNIQKTRIMKSVRTKKEEVNTSKIIRKILSLFILSQTKFCHRNFKYVTHFASLEFVLAL